MPSRKQTEEPVREKICFWAGDSLKRLPKLNRLAKEAGQKRITQSYVFREGAKHVIDDLIRKFTKALKGEFHAKRRK